MKKKSEAKDADGQSLVLNKPIYYCFSGSGELLRNCILELVSKLDERQHKLYGHQYHCHLKMSDNFMYATQAKPKLITQNYKTALRLWRDNYLKKELEWTKKDEKACKRMASIHQKKIKKLETQIKKINKLKE